MPIMPYPISGKIYNKDNNLQSGVYVQAINTRTGEGTQSNTTTSNGEYTLDLANLNSGYSDNDIIFLKAYGISPENYGSEFVTVDMSIGSSEQDLTVYPIVDRIVTPSYSDKPDIEHDPTSSAKRVLIVTKEGKFISITNPLYVLDTNSTNIKIAIEAINTALQSGGITQVQLDAIKTAVELIDNAISGSEMQVDIVDVVKTATPTTVQATASGNTTVWTPASGKKLRVKFIIVFNSGTANDTIYLRFTATGTARFRATLVANTGYTLNLIGCNWEGATDEALIINLSATGTIDITVLGEEI